MNKAEVIVRKYADKLVPEAFIKKVYELKPDLVGFAKLDKIEGGLSLVTGNDDLNFDDFIKAQNNLKAEEMIFHFGHAPLSFEDVDTIQPFNLFVEDDAVPPAQQVPMVACFIEGNFPDFADPSEAKRSAEYTVFSEYIKPMFEKAMNEAGGAYEKMLENIEHDKIFRRSLDKICTGRGVILIYGVDGKGPITFGTNELSKQFPWGQVSNHLGYEEGAAPVAAGSKLSKLSLKLFTGGKKTEAPAQQEAKADPTPVPMAAVPTVKAKPKFSLSTSPTATATPVVKKEAPATAVAPPPAPADLSATHIKVLIPKNLQASNKRKKWIRKRAHDGLLPPNWNATDCEIWVDKEQHAAELISEAKGQAAMAAKVAAKATAPVKTFQQIDPAKVKTVEAPIKDSNTMAKHLANPAPVGSGKEPLLVSSPTVKKQIATFIDTLHGAKVLDHTSRVILNPAELGKEPTYATFTDISGMEMHEMIRVPAEAWGALCKEAPEAAKLALWEMSRVLGSRMTTEELNPPFEEEEAEKYAAPGAIPAAVEPKKVAAGGGKFRLRL